MIKFSVLFNTLFVKRTTWAKRDIRHGARAPAAGKGMAPAADPKTVTATIIIIDIYNAATPLSSCFNGINSYPPDTVPLLQLRLIKYNMRYLRKSIFFEATRRQTAIAEKNSRPLFFIIFTVWTKSN
jgi:hypothetical protein